MTWILLFALGLLYANAIEWWMHKYVLHGLGQKKNSFWKFHWRTHHQKARKNDFSDSDYQDPLLQSPPQYREFGMLVIGVALHLPLLFVAPWFFLGAAALGLSYFPLHKKSHLDPEWCKKWMPWHYDHHMGINQNANWCVTVPLFDYLLGTRIKYKYENGKPIKDIR